MNVFIIDYLRLIEFLSPTFFRKPVIKALLISFITPVIYNYNAFKNYRLFCLYRLSHNGQISYLEDVMNDYFDNTQRRIRIANVEFKDPIYFYEPQENREVFFYEPTDNKPVYFYESQDFLGDGVDFVVMVPPSLRPLILAQETALLTQMKGQLDYYKLYSKNYKIVWVQANI